MFVISVCLFGCYVWLFVLTLATIGFVCFYSKTTFLSQFRFFLQNLCENERPKVRIILTSEPNIIYEVLDLSAIRDSVFTGSTEMNESITELQSLIEGFLLESALEQAELNGVLIHKVDSLITLVSLHITSVFGDSVFLLGNLEVVVRLTACNQLNESRILLIIHKDHNLGDGEQRQRNLGTVDMKSTTAARAIERHQILRLLEKELIPMLFLRFNGCRLSDDFKATLEATVILDDTEIFAQQVHTLLGFETTGVFILICQLYFQLNAEVVRRTTMKGNLRFGVVGADRTVESIASITHDLILANLILH